MGNVLILANSKKHSAHCVAGVDIETFKWVRPVGPGLDGELNESQCRVHSGTTFTQAQSGDLIEMPLGRGRPTLHHPEDVEIAGKWNAVDHWPVERIRTSLRSIIAVDRPPLGSYRDRVPVAEIGQNPNHRSLDLFDLPRTEFYATTSLTGNRQIRGRLKFGKWLVDLSTTDIAFTEAMATVNEVVLDRCLVTMSLALPFVPQGAVDPFCFKVIAGVMRY